MILRPMFLCVILVNMAVGAVSVVQESVAPAPVTVAQPGDDLSPSGFWTTPLALPDVVRFRQLPMRMYLEPQLWPPAVLSVFNDRMIPHFAQVLQEASDAEIQEVAALSLARVARENLGDIRSIAEALKSVMRKTSDDKVRHACAFALAAADVSDSAADLLQIASAASDAERIVIEAALARWKFEMAGDLWRARLVGRSETVASVRLACEGLAALEDQKSLSAMVAILRDGSLEIAKRMAVARAISSLNPQEAFREATDLIKGSVPDRLLTVALLDHRNAESHLQTERLCEDVSDAVAAAAWQQLFGTNPESLKGHLPSGRVHRDAAVRMTAARIMRQFPTAERASWLNEMFSDRHIEVRNTARRMQVQTATENTELRDGIVDLAVASLRADSADWQGMEQALVLLGQLQATQFSAECVSMLNHPRPEVAASAAWLIHLYPDPAIKEPVVQQVIALEAHLRDTISQPDDSGLPLGFLLQYCGLLRYSEVQTILEKQYDKRAPGGPDMRAAAMWTVGLLHERNPDPTVIAKLEGRINDRNPMDPEAPQVRRMSVMALGLMRAKTSIPVLQNAFQMDAPEMLIPGMVRRVLPLLGEPMPDDYPPITQLVNGWRLMPVESGF